MPTQIVHSSNGTTEITYGGTGERVRKRVYSGGTVTDTYYIGDHFEVRGGVTMKYIFAGNLRVAQVKGTTRSFFHKDHLGSSTVMTDNSGGEIESTEYMPFGSQRNHSGTNTSDYRFTDQELDSENGLYNYNARLYDPFIGRFISPDTIVPQPYNPQSLNRYSYCLNNPLSYIDPSGHQEEEFTYGDFCLYRDMLAHELKMRELHGGGSMPYDLGFSTGFETWLFLSGTDFWDMGFAEYNSYLLWNAMGGSSGGGGFSLGLVTQTFNNPYNDVDGVAKDAESALKKARLDPKFQMLERIWLNDRPGNNPFSLVVIDKSDWPTAGFDPDSGKIVISLHLFTMGYETLAETMERFTPLHVVVHEAVEASYMGLMVTHCDIINETSDIMVRLDTLYVRRTCSYEDTNIINYNSYPSK